MINRSIAKRIFEALRKRGSHEHLVPSGDLLEQINDLALGGELRGVSQAYLSCAAAAPTEAGFVADMVPAKMLNDYIYRNRKASIPSVMRWIARNPDWADRIKRALPYPARFERMITAMADQAITAN